MLSARRIMSRISYETGNEGMIKKKLNNMETREFDCCSLFEELRGHVCDKFSIQGKRYNDAFLE